ncbi:hypothetical protein D3C80_1274900 [compost metagenome]
MSYAVALLEVVQVTLIALWVPLQVAVKATVKLPGVALQFKVVAESVPLELFVPKLPFFAFT